MTDLAAGLSADQRESLARVHEQAAADSERLLTTGRLRTSDEQATLLAFHQDAALWHRNRAREIRTPAAPPSTDVVGAAHREAIRALSATLARWAAGDADAATIAWLAAHLPAAAGSLDWLPSAALAALATEVAAALAGPRRAGPSPQLEIAEQRARNHARWGAGSIENRAARHPEWLQTLGEEFGKVCRALMEEPPRLRAELIDLTAVGLAWLDRIDSDDSAAAARASQMCGSLAFGGDSPADQHRCTRLRHDNDTDHADDTHHWAPGRHPLVVADDTAEG